MADELYLIKKETLTEIADAVRAKTGADVSETIKVSEMAAQIENIEVNSNDNKFTQYITRTLTEITQEDLKNNTEIYAYAFYYQPNLTLVEIPNNIKSIGQYSFYRCTNLSNIVLPNTISVLNTYTFSGCKSFTSITLPNSMSIINSYGLSSCDNLTTIIFGSGISKIGLYAFFNCDSLKLLDFRLAVDVPTLQLATSGTSQTIPKNDGLQIIVPDELYDAWIIATNWTDYTDYIVKASEYIEEEITE